MDIKECVVIPLLRSIITNVIIGVTAGFLASWRGWVSPGTTSALVWCPWLWRYGGMVAGASAAIRGKVGKSADL